MEGKHGITFPLELGVNEVGIGGATMYVGTLCDISEKKDVEAKLADECQKLISEDCLK